MQNIHKSPTSITAESHEVPDFVEIPTSLNEVFTLLTEAESGKISEEDFIKGQKSFFTSLQMERAREEMFQYAVNLVNSKFGGNTTEEALANWELYKSALAKDVKL